MQEMTASRARNMWPTLQDAAARHEPTVITRRRGQSVVVVSDEDLRAILASYAFTTEVFREAGGVSIWLNELGIWGKGASFVEAKDDLLDEIDELFALLDSDHRYLASSDVERKLPWIYRLRLARTDQERLEMLLAAPTPAAR
jgi:hypothetical protein